MGNILSSLLMVSAMECFSRQQRIMYVSPPLLPPFPLCTPRQKLIPPRPNYTNALLRSDDIPQRAACSAAYCFCAKRAFVMVCVATAQPTNMKFLGSEKFPCLAHRSTFEGISVQSLRAEEMVLFSFSLGFLWGFRPSTIGSACIART